VGRLRFIVAGRSPEPSQITTCGEAKLGKQDGSWYGCFARSLDMTASAHPHEQPDLVASQPRPGRFCHWLCPALLAIALYAVTLRGGYVYDDVWLLTEDPRLHDPSQWSRYLTESYNKSVDNLYRPLTSLSYAVGWWLHGDRKWAFHLVNILLHAGVCACVAEVALRLTRGNRTAALIAGLLFAAHPIHVEAVANVAGRPELICALGLFGAIALSLKPITLWRGCAIGACTAVAIFGKEQGIFLPPMLIALFAARRWSGCRDLGAARSLCITLCVCLLGYIIARNAVLPFSWERFAIDWTVNPMVPSSGNRLGGSVGRDAWLMPVVLLGRYAALLIAPARLSPDYGALVIGCVARFDDPYLYLGFAALLTWAFVLTWSIRRRSWSGAFLCIALALTYSMVGNFMSYIGTIFAERLMYTPSAFFLILLAIPLSRVAANLRIAVMTVLLLAGGLRTYTYARLWNDPLKLYQTTSAQKPGSVKLRILLAHQYMIRGDFPDAERVAADARSALPQYADVWVRSAIIAMEQKKWDQAGEYLHIAMQVDPHSYVLDWFAELARRRAAASPATSQTSSSQQQ
jgi:hypothetical protein